jgi:hypothetical protein
MQGLLLVLVVKGRHHHFEYGLDVLRRPIEEVVFRYEIIHVVLLLSDFACQVHFKAVVVFILLEISECPLLSFVPLIITLARLMSQVPIEHLTRIRGQSARRLFVQPVDLRKNPYLLLCAPRLGDFLEKLIDVPAHEYAFLIPDTVHHVVDDFPVASFEIVEGGQCGAHIVELVVIVFEHLLR